MKHFISLLILLGLSQVCFANSSPLTPQQKMEMSGNTVDVDEIKASVSQEKTSVTPRDVIRGAVFKKNDVNTYADLKDAMQAKAETHEFSPPTQDDLEDKKDTVAEWQEKYSDGSIQDDRQPGDVIKLIFQNKKSNVAGEIQVTDEQIANAPSHSENGAQLDAILDYWDFTLTDKQKESFDDIKTNSRRAKTGGLSVNKTMSKNRQE